MKKKKKTSKKNKHIIIIITTLIVLTLIPITTTNTQLHTQTFYLSSKTNQVKTYTFNTKKLTETTSLPRGIKVTSKNKTITINNQVYKEIYLNNKTYYVSTNNITTAKNNLATETQIYTKTPATILKDKTTSEILSYTKKGEKLKVIDYDTLDKEGNVITYKVEKNNTQGYIYGKYTTYTQEQSQTNYNQETYNNIYSKIKNPYNGGEPTKLDYHHYPKANFQNNQMPESVYALYLNSNVLKNIDDYIEFAKDTKINSFVVDIKDNESPAYPATIYKTQSPTNYQNAINTYDEYKEAITKLKQNNFYVIGRITVFKDNYYVKDNPEIAITTKTDNTPYKHNGSYWPSAYNRKVWYYNVALAKEAIQEFGFNEINFDYVRFPDKMQKIEANLDLQNSYNEDKIEAIANFVRYATDEIHNLEAYISIDVFGETTNGTYTTAYGQYWPAISNIADVISAMPYPDHFSDGYYGIKQPWNNPYQLLKTWGLFAQERQKETPSPAKVRTWIQAYDVMKHVDPNGIKYNAQVVEQEIRALYESSLTGGYITWLSSSSLNKYQQQKQAFKIDYIKEIKQWQKK